MQFVKVFGSTLLAILVTISIGVLGIIVTLNMTLLDPDFVVDEMDKYDVYSVIFDEVKEHIPEIIPEEVIDDLFTRYRPWLEEQVHKIIYAVYSFIKEGKELNVVISLEPIYGNMEETIMGYIYDYLPPALVNAPEYLIEPYISGIYQEIKPYIPDEIVLNEETVGTEVITGLEEVRQVLHYMRIVYIIAVSIIVLALIVIALLYRWRFRPFSLYAGIAFICAGVIALINALVARSLIAGADLFAEADFAPEGLQEIVVQIITDSTQPLLYYGIGFAVAGMALLLSSFFVRQLE
jgi:hypothetical protein